MGFGHGRKRARLRRRQGPVQRQERYEVPEWSEVNYEYADGTKMICGQGQPGGTTFEGKDGTIFVNRAMPSKRSPTTSLPSRSSDSDVHLYESKRPLRQLARLHSFAEAADLRRGDRSPVGHRVPLGQHRDPFAEDGALGSGEGANRRRH